MVFAIGSSNPLSLNQATEGTSHCAVKQGISSASTLRSAAFAEDAPKTAAPAPAQSGGLSGCISKVVTSIKNFFSGIMNWFLGLCGKGSSPVVPAAPAKGSLEAFLAILDDKDAKSSTQTRAFKKLCKKDFAAVAKEMRVCAKAKNAERKKKDRKTIGDVDAFKQLALNNPLTEKVKNAVEAVVKARAEAASKKPA